MLPFRCSNQEQRAPRGIVGRKKLQKDSAIGTQGLVKVLAPENTRQQPLIFPSFLPFLSFLSTGTGRPARHRRRRRSRAKKFRPPFLLRTEPTPGRSSACARPRRASAPRTPTREGRRRSRLSLLPLLLPPKGSSTAQSCTPPSPSPTASVAEREGAGETLPRRGAARGEGERRRRGSPRPRQLQQQLRRRRPRPSSACRGSSASGKRQRPHLHAAVAGGGREEGGNGGGGGARDRGGGAHAQSVSALECAALRRSTVLEGDRRGPAAFPRLPLLRKPRPNAPRRSGRERPRRGGGAGSSGSRGGGGRGALPRPLASRNASARTAQRVGLLWAAPPRPTRRGPRRPRALRSSRFLHSRDRGPSALPWPPPRSRQRADPPRSPRAPPAVVASAESSAPRPELARPGHSVPRRGPPDGPAGRVGPAAAERRSRPPRSRRRPALPPPPPSSPSPPPPAPPSRATPVPTGPARAGSPEAPPLTLMLMSMLMLMLMQQEQQQQNEREKKKRKKRRKMEVRRSLAAGPRQRLGERARRLDTRITFSSDPLAYTAAAEAAGSRGR